MEALDGNAIPGLLVGYPQERVKTERFGPTGGG